MLKPFRDLMPMHVKKKIKKKICAQYGFFTCLHSFLRLMKGGGPNDLI
jgi:hypothetical protein